MMSHFEGHARDLARRFVAKAMSGRRGAKNCTRFLRFIVIIVAVTAVTTSVAFCMQCSFSMPVTYRAVGNSPKGVTVSQIPCTTHVRLGGTG